LSDLELIDPLLLVSSLKDILYREIPEHLVSLQSHPHTCQGMGLWGGCHVWLPKWGKLQALFATDVIKFHGNCQVTLCLCAINSAECPRRYSQRTFYFSSRWNCPSRFKRFFFIFSHITLHNICVGLGIFGTLFHSILSC